jgi:hypothetical protein
MNLSDRKVSVRNLFATSLVLAGALAASSAANASDAAAAKGASCLEESRKVVVWPAGSGKSNQFGRVENHVVTICDGKVVSSKPERAAARAKAAGNREGA